MSYKDKMKKKKMKKKINVYDTVSGLYNNFIEIYYDEYNDLSDAKKNTELKYDPTNSFLKTYN